MLYENSYLILIAAIFVDFFLSKSIREYCGFARVLYWIVFLGWISTLTADVAEIDGDVNRAEAHVGASVRQVVDTLIVDSSEVGD